MTVDTVRLGDVLAEVSRPEPVTAGKQYRLLGVKWYAKGAFVREELPANEIKAKYLYRVEHGDFVYNRLFAWKGSFAIIPEAFTGNHVSNEFPLFRISAPDKIDSRFLSLFFAREKAWKQAEKLCVGSSRQSRFRLKEDRFLGLSIPLPPLSEQERIADILEHALRRITEARQLQDSFSGEHRAFLSARARELAEGVPRQPMREVAPLVRRPITIKETSLYPELGIHSFGRGTFHKPALTAEVVGTKRLFSIEPGDLLFSNVFAWEGAIAVARPEDSDRCGSHRFMTCVPRPEIATPEFLCFWFLSDEGMAHIRAASPGAAGRNRTLGLNKLAEIPVPVPPIALQQSFSRLCNQLESAATLQRDFPAELEALQSSLLDQAFSGNL